MKRTKSGLLCLIPCLVMSAQLGMGQSVISAHSGIVHYVEGTVTIDGSTTNPKFGQFPEIRKDQVLATEDGRAEILLTPGVFLRLAENSSVRMIANSLADTRLEMVSGSALVEVAQLLPDNAVTMLIKGSEVSFVKKGLFRLNLESPSAQLRVYDGQALVARTRAETPEKIVAKKGHQIDLETTQLTDTKFSVDDTDALYRWSARRASYIATANLVSARVAGNSSSAGYSSGYSSGFLGGGMWSFNPYMGMYSYLPVSGIVWSPFGMAYYSPGVAYYITSVPLAGVASNGLGGAGIGPLRPRSSLSASSVAPPSASRLPGLLGSSTASSTRGFFGSAGPAGSSVAAAPHAAHMGGGHR